ncbi:MAG: helix-turn-helix domain-containing protein [Actinophytocola sp.]|nr:helix-turn-helix domain-containing protein [Actinophytocola sp.]
MVLGDLRLPKGTWFEWHRHPQHQIAWTPETVLAVEAGGAQWVLPPTRALFLPGGVLHRTGAIQGGLLRGIYIEPDRCPGRWESPTMLRVGPLLRELLEYLADDALDAERRLRAEAVVFDVLEPVRAVPIGVRLPVDDRARKVASALIADPADQRTLDGHASDVGASARTLARVFQRETSMSFGRWRTQVRLRAALPLLAEGVPLAGVATRVGYSTPSAFVVAFHREVGISPARYFAA